MSDILGRGAKAEMQAASRIPQTILDRLQFRKEQLQVELARIEKSLAILQANPQINELLDHLQSVNF